MEELYTAFESADTIVLKKYVNALEKLSVYDSNIEPIKQIQLGGNICLYHIEKIVYDAKENIHDKLTTIYSSLSYTHRRLSTHNVLPSQALNTPALLEDIYITTCVGSSKLHPTSSTLTILPLELRAIMSR